MPGLHLILSSLQSTIIPLLQIRKLRHRARILYPPSTKTPKPMLPCTTLGRQRFLTSPSELLICPLPKRFGRPPRRCSDGGACSHSCRPDCRKGASERRAPQLAPGFSRAEALELQSPAGSCRGRRRRWDQSGEGVRERASRLASAQRSERSSGHWCGGLGSRRRQAGTELWCSSSARRRPGCTRAVPGLGGNVRTGPRLCLAHCGDLAFAGGDRAPQRESSGDRGLFSGPRGAPQGAQYRYCSRARRGAGAPSRRWSPGCKKREAPPPGLERGATGSGDPGRRTEPSPRPASGAPASAPLFPPGLEAPGAERHRESGAGRGALAAPSGARGRRAGAGDAGARPPAQATADSPEAEPQRRVR